MPTCTEHAPGIKVEWAAEGAKCPLCVAYESDGEVRGQLQTLRNFLREGKTQCMENGIEWCCMDNAFMNDPELRPIVAAKYDEDPTL